jgi:hypothetical protein
MMTEEDEAFNEIERQAKQRKESVTAALENAEIRVTELKKRLDVLSASRNDTINEVLQLIKELRPAIMPLEGMGRGKATQEWFDILVKHIEEMKQ